MSWFEALWPLVAILVVLAVVMSLRARRMEAAQAQPAVAVLADRSPPAVPAADGLPGDASSALVDLERGQCDLAAARLRTSRLRNPQVVELALLEAGTWVCAGDGARAEEASQAYLQGGGQTNAELLWVQAQAALLRGEATHARDRLVRLRPLVDLERGARIDEQLAGLRSL
ncbi:hypothetical protein L6R53_19270 [Myxococcota bacterium]|nr:hypothetical protein [Myxococcota bacterium]